jgi:hypothetical protein
MTDQEQREHERSATVSAVGRSYCYIKCPFCDTSCKAYIWSLAGGGKLCPGCKAMHTSFGKTVRRPPKPAARRPARNGERGRPRRQGPRLKKETTMADHAGDGLTGPAPLMSYEQALAEIGRIATGCGVELPPDGTLAEAARLALNSANPPRGDDEAFCLRVLSGNVIAG